MPTVFTVNTTNDILNDSTVGEVTLRDALTAIINQATSGQAPAGTPGSNTIDFSIGAPGSTQTISLGSALPTIANNTIAISVFIDGGSQGGSPYSGPPLIVLNGASAGSGANGLNFAAGSNGSEVQGLVIQQFSGNGILINGTSGNLVVGNYIGTDVNGTANLGNSTGVLLQQGATANTIGGTAAGTANVVSGNTFGVFFSISGTSGNVVLGNFIGTDVHGTAALGNGTRGVAIEFGATANTIGGTTTDSGNVISGNGDGVVSAEQRHIGQRGAGQPHRHRHPRHRQPRQRQDGVLIANGATANTMGGTAAGAGNVMSGNTNNSV